MFLNIFFSLLVLPVNAETTAPDVSGQEEGLTYESSQFFSCQSRSENNGQGSTGWVFNRIPEQDQRGNRTTDFLLELQSRIEKKIQDNIAFSDRITRCFTPTFANFQDTDCQSLLRSIDPSRYGNVPRDSAEYRDSFAYQLRVARSQLAVAATNPNESNFFSSNESLNSHGFKSVPWNPLSAAEKKAAENTLLQYRDQFKQLHNLTDTELDALLLPFDRSKVGEIWANPMNITPEETRHLVLQSELDRNITRMRRGHLEKYREIVSQYPIINYLSSNNPSPLEFQRAGKELKRNAQSELERVRAWGESLRAKPPRLSHEELNLLDYRGVVEEFLNEQPRFCAVASGAQRARDRRAMRNTALTVAPILAASFFAPPAAAMIVMVGASGAYATASYLDYRYQQEGAFAAPVNDGSLRSDQFAVDAARRQLTTDLLMVPVDVVLTGGLSAGIRRTQNAIRRTGKSID